MSGNIDFAEHYADFAENQMTGPNALTKRSRNKIVIFLAVVALLIGGLSAGWYWAAGQLDQTVTRFTQTMRDNGRQLECGGQDVAGYPFRIGVFCDRLAYEDASSGISVTGGALRTAAQLYRPGHVVAELDAPFDIVLPGLAPLTLEWRNLKTSSNVSTSGPERISLVADAVQVSANDFGERDLLANLEELQLHARPGPANPDTLDLALSADGWKIDDNGAGAIQPVDLRFSASLEEGLLALRRGEDLLAMLKARGGKGELADFTITTEDGGLLSISGPLEVDARGRLSGLLTINMENPALLVEYASSVFPPAGEALSDTAKYLQAFAKQENGKAIIRDFKVTLEKGKVLAGFFQVGEIPRLF